MPPELKESIFDGDKLFMQKRREYWKSGIKSHKECKKLAIEFVINTFDSLVDEALHTANDFAYEGHFTNDATWDIPIKFLEHGYQIYLIFFGLTDTALSETRVIGRTQEGGHYVDPQTIANSFFGNLEKLDKYYRIFHSVTIIDTSLTEHIALAEIRMGVCMYKAPYNRLPSWFIVYLPNIVQCINSEAN